MFEISIRPKKRANMQSVSDRPHFFCMFDHFKTQEMCIKAVGEDPWDLVCVPDHLKTQEVCDDTVSADPYSLK